MCSFDTFQPPIAAIVAACSEDLGTTIDGVLAGGRFELMQQRLRVGGRDITLVVPRDVDAVMQMYIDAGATFSHQRQGVCTAGLQRMYESFAVTGSPHTAQGT